MIVQIQNILQESKNTLEKTIKWFKNPKNLKDYNSQSYSI